MAELRKYLKERGVPFSSYNKNELINIVNKCITCPDLVSVVEEDDNESVRAERRTVEINGKLEIFPDPLSLSGWKERVSMPPVSTDKAMLYLIFKMNWSQGRISNWKNERGYNLFQSNHIHEVLVKETENKFLYIKGKCTRQTSQQEVPYDVWILTAEEGTIACAGCQCIG